MYDCIRDSNLVSATIISFSFSGNTGVAEERGSKISMLDLLADAAQAASITLVIGQPIKVRSGIHTDLSRLSLSGVNVMLEFDLHAKVALFDFGDRKTWMIGSSNVTRGGFSDNAEVNLIGYRESEYKLIAASVDEIVKRASSF
jgi:phosphatidylserine/phosphatidylglycerophosphate/cardiolipin synthase-like enzyme